MTDDSTLVPMRGYAARHFRFAASADGKVATITLDRPEKKNPLTFDSYAELRDLFRALVYASDVKAVVVTGAGGNFCSGGDVHEIIGPLTRMAMPELLAFTRMTGDLVMAMRRCPQPIVAAVDGVCAGAGAMVALASDLRLGTPAAQHRLPVHARRARRLRHGRVHAAAAHDRAGTRGGAALHRPRDDRRRRPRLGLLQSRWSTPRRSPAKRTRWRAASPTVRRSRTR